MTFHVSYKDKRYTCHLAGRIISRPGHCFPSWSFPKIPAAYFVAFFPHWFQMVESAMQGDAVRWPALAPEISPGACWWWLGLPGYYFGYLGPLEIFGGPRILHHATPYLDETQASDKPTRKRRQLVSIMAESKTPPPTWVGELISSSSLVCRLSHHCPLRAV